MAFNERGETSYSNGRHCHMFRYVTGALWIRLSSLPLVTYILYIWLSERALPGPRPHTHALRPRACGLRGLWRLNSAVIK
jgi:hypothetical protein